jgi:hypothetical protein
MKNQDLTREQRIDLGYKLLNYKSEMLISKLGEITNIETLKEGRINFTYEVMIK